MKYLHLLLCCAVAALAPGYARAEDASKEYMVKAAFIYNFVKFVEWPGEKAVAKQSKLDICVIGNNPLVSAVSIFKEASSPSLKLNLTEERNLSAVPGHCHILFIGASEEAQIPGILEGLKGQPVLTVSDIPGFIQRDGMIGFVLVSNKVKLAVNRKAIEAAGMHVDAQLLEIALEVIR